MKNCGGGGIRRSSSSEPLLESAPASHRTPAVAAYPREAKETAPVGVQEEEAVVVVESQEKLAQMAAASNKGFDMKLGEAARNKGGGTCSPGEAAKQEQEMEGKKKKKKRRSWLPDPQKRWPMQFTHGKGDDAVVNAITRSYDKRCQRCRKRLFGSRSVRPTALEKILGSLGHQQ